MRGIVFSIFAISCVLIVAPLAPAQQRFHDPQEFVIENLCDPNPAEEEFDEQWIFTGLDPDHVEKIRIQLLERGFDPGFDPHRDNTLDAQLVDALAQFQGEYELPVTGLPDAATLDALSVSTQS